MRIYKKIIVSVFIFLSFFVLTSSVDAASSQYQKCSKGTNCVVGEFLYDDEYTPIATASCTLTSRDTVGAVLLNSVAMTANTDGWYEYTVTTSDKVEGLYRSQMCCTVASTDYLCLDRSFYITPADLSTSAVAGAVWNAQTASHSAAGTFGKNLQNPTLTAADIWGYANRSLTSYGNLISDIWNYSTRSISGFGNLANDVWSSTVRTLTGTKLSSGDDLATKQDIDAVNTSTTQTINTVNTNNNKNVTDTLSFGNGSIIFHATVSNPSTVIAQTVPFLYYLPSEVKESNVITIDPTLILNSSLSNPAIAVRGEIELEPAKSHIYSIEVKDVWVIPGSEIASLRSQTDTLFKPLARTSFFGQGSTIKSDIFASLDRILSGQANASSPEEHISAYREGVISLRAAKDKLNDLKSLVASAGSIGTIFGFVGGIQVFAVWGLVIVFIAGFVFLALYMKNLKNQETHEIEENINRSHLITGAFSENNGSLFHNSQIKFLTFGLIIGAGILFGLFLIPKNNTISENNKEKVPVVRKKAAISPQVFPTKASLPSMIPTERKIIITEDALNVREEAGSIYKKVATVKKGEEYLEIERKKDLDGESWINIQVEKNRKGWILAKYTSGAENSNVLGTKDTINVTVIVPEGEVVIVRDTPALTGKKVMALSKEIPTRKLDEESGWVKVTEGWVPAIYIQEIKK